MTRRKSETDIIETLCRRYGIKADGVNERVYLATRKLEAIIVRAHADLAELHTSVKKIDERGIEERTIVFTVEPKAPEPSIQDQAHNRREAVEKVIRDAATAAEHKAALDKAMPGIVELIQDSRILNAIKRYREAAPGASIREAKDAVERIQADLSAMTDA